MSVKDVSVGRHGWTDAGPVHGNAHKRQRIIDGARATFLEKGFDGASVDEIAQSASVSKATLYYYFHSKEALFRELIRLDRERSAEFQLVCESNATDVATILREIGLSFMMGMVEADHIRLLRIVISAAEKFPSIAQAFFEGGPCTGQSRFAALLARQVALGRLDIEDLDTAASQFLNLCQADVIRGMLFGKVEQPSSAQLAAHVDAAVRVFLAAYESRSDKSA